MSNPVNFTLLYSTPLYFNVKQSHHLPTYLFVYQSFGSLVFISSVLN